MADYLAPLKEPDVAAFYRRLALSIQARFHGDSLAAILLLHWLDGGGKDKVYPAKYVKDLVEVQSYLLDTARPIFLSRSKTPSGITGGIIPRIKGTARSNPPDPPGGPYRMHLEGNVETPLTIEFKAKYGMKVEPRELDALFALHGFQMISDVTVSAEKTPNPGMYLVKFRSWTCKASDEYHWNPAKHIKVPNPDFGSKDKWAIAAGDKDIEVYHSNAIRVEKAGLANPFHDESEPWDETDPAVTAPASVTPESE